MSEKIMTLHPEGKNGVNIDLAKYEQMRDVILEELEVNQPIRFSDLSKIVAARLEGNFDGSIMWYFTTVKLDLEARGALKRKKISGKEMLVM
ncbi:MAG: hypothetical protein AAF570_14075 [Bacteroidota bacterium]